jgi:DhnA family fructose-bisphosphate aldolase class Ia
MIEGSIQAGGSGCLVGRNFSEAQSIEKIVRAASKIIRYNSSAGEAAKELL